MLSAELSGRVALVTGAGRGIGRAIAMALAQAGARVALLARSREQLADTAAAIASTTHVVVADVRDRVQMEAAIASSEETLGAIDILVNNAGIGGPIRPVAETGVDEWWEAMEVNLYGPLITMRRLLPGMISRKRGSIINVVASPGAFAYFSAYSASKAGLIRLSECLAAEVEADGVAVFAMAPGTVRTALSERSLESDDGKRWLPWFKRIFDEGLDLPSEAPAKLAVRLASGRYDALSGLIINPRDDIDLMLSQLDEIRREKLYSMRLRTLLSPDQQRLNAIRDSGTAGRR